MKIILGSYTYFASNVNIYNLAPTPSPRVADIFMETFEEVELGSSHYKSTV